MVVLKRTAMLESESPSCTTYFLVTAVLPASVLVALTVGVGAGSSMTPELTTMPTRAITATRNTTGAAMRAAIREEREPAADRGGRARGARLAPLTGRGGRLGGGSMNGSTTGSRGSGAGPACAGGVPAVPMDSRRRSAASGSSGSSGG